MFSGTVFANNTSTGYGGAINAGLWLSGQNGRFEANRAVGATTGKGGAIYVAGTMTLTNLVVVSNTAGEDGGGLNANNEQAIVNGGNFLRNTATRYGGGWYVGNTASLTNTSMTSNTATWGGGGYAAGTVLHGAQVTGNTATSGGGGGLYSSGQNAIDASRFAGNSATQGGALYIFRGSGDIVNSLLADNQASTSAADLFISPFSGNVSIVFSTLAGPALNPRQAIVLNSGTLHVTDTIVSNYAVGISVTTGSATENYNLFYGNTANSLGAVTHGGNSLTGQNPLFANPGAGDYNLTPGSPAIDHGVNAGVSVDYYGHPRPSGSGFDIGFDEVATVVYTNWVYLPLVRR